MCSRVYVSELFIYACHLPLAHELARGKGKGSQETVELCDIFERVVSTCTHTHTHPQIFQAHGKQRDIPVS